MMRKIMLLILILFVLLSITTSAQEPPFIYKAIKSTVMVKTNTGDVGAGFYITEDTILTNAHVVLTPGVREIRIILSNKTECKGTLGYREEGIDLAIVKVDCSGVPLLAAPFTDLGEDVYAIGHPQGIPFVVTKGIVSYYADKWVFSDVTISVGNSGGPIVDNQARVVGISTKLHQETRLTLAVQTSSIQKFIERAGLTW